MNWTSADRGIAAVMALGAVGLVAAGWSASTQGCFYGPWDLLPEGGPEGGAGGSPSCDAAVLPPRPALTAGSQPGNFTMIAAMQSIDVGVGVTLDGGIIASLDGGTYPLSAPIPPFGWNLDGICTSGFGTESCIQDPPDGSPNEDDSRGRDDTGVKLFRLLGVAAQSGNATANASMQAGLYGIVIVMTGYNNMQDDNQVSVALYASSGVLGVDGGPPVVYHKGTDPWTVDPSYVAITVPEGASCSPSSCPPAFVDDNAYVANGVLVANLGTVPIRFGASAAIGGAKMLLHSTYLTGTVKPWGGTTSGVVFGITNGFIQGRWWSTDLLANMATIPDSKRPGEFLCGDPDAGGDPDYPPVKAFVCSLQDIAAAPGGDNMGQQCSAISMALGFTAEPAQLGVIASTLTAPMGCVGEGGAAFSDTCP